MQKFQLELEVKENLAPNIYKLIFKIEDGIEFQYQAGQFVGIEVAEKVKRFYSIASAPSHIEPQSSQQSAQQIELLVDTSPGGPGSQFFEKVQVGEAVNAMGPFGHFVFKSKGDVVFVATGTGLAPFRSIILELLAKEYSGKLKLVWGVRKEENLYLVEEFEKLAETHPNFEYIPTLSQGSEEWKGHRGRVTQYLEEMQLESDEVPADFYLCGIKAMLDDAKKILMEKGVAQDKIFFEQY